MIYSVAVDPANPPVPWWPKVPWLARGPFEFGPGVTVLFGPNGSGKSTLLHALARAFHVEQGGRPVLTLESLDRLRTRGHSIASDDKLGALRGLEVRHDGRVAGFFDCGSRPGLAMGGHAFDDDFLSEGLAEILNKGSSGQNQLRRMDPVFQAGSSLKDKVGTGVNEYWLGLREQALAFLRPNAAEGLPTVLFDEPEASLSIPNRILLWRKLCSFGTQMQIIAATHDVFPLFLPEGSVSIVETEEGYQAACRRDVAAFIDANK